jgi:hypothetical protein
VGAEEEERGGCDGREVPRVRGWVGEAGKGQELRRGKERKRRWTSFRWDEY